MSHSGTRNQKQNIATNRGVFSVVFGDAGINGQRSRITLSISSQFNQVAKCIIVSIYRYALV